MSHPRNFAFYSHVWLIAIELKAQCFSNRQLICMGLFAYCTYTRLKAKAFLKVLTTVNTSIKSELRQVKFRFLWLMTEILFPFQSQPVTFLHSTENSVSVAVYLHWREFPITKWGEKPPKGTQYFCILCTTTKRFWLLPVSVVSKVFLC